MVEWLATVFGCLHKDAEVFNHLVLTVEIGKTKWTERILKRFFGGTELLVSYVKVFCHRLQRYK